MVKVFDMSLVADRALDLYAEKNSPRAYVGGRGVPISTRSVAVAADRALAEAAEEYCVRYDVTYAAVPCFPIMRSASEDVVLTRFRCVDEPCLRRLGISAHLFMESFEKFLVSRCCGPRTEMFDGKLVVLKEKNVLYSDWVSMITEKYGSSLVDCSVSAPFDANPGMILNCEEDLSAYDKLDDFSEFNAKRLL